MKLVSLNAWGATQGQPFYDYILSLAESTDIFCFQEIFSAKQPAPKLSTGARMYMLEELQELLPEYNFVFSEKSTGSDFGGKVQFPVRHGLATFVKKNLEIVESSTLKIKEGLINLKDPVEGFLIVQASKISKEGKQFDLFNYHGIGQPGTKQDTPERLEASKRIKGIWEESKLKAKILCGDFNLNPETESIKIIEAFSENLISKFEIKNTRNEVSWKRYNNIQHFADYVFTSTSLKVKAFEVPYNLVSDHLPMILEFEL